MFLAEAAVLGATEGELVVGDLDTVDPGIAGVEPVDALLGPLEIAGEDRRAEPELGVVGTGKGLVEVLDPGDREQRTEGLLPPHARLRRDIGDDGRLEEEATIERLAPQPAAAGQQ